MHTKKSEETQPGKPEVTEPESKAPAPKEPEKPECPESGIGYDAESDECAKCVDAKKCKAATEKVAKALADARKKAAKNAPAMRQCFW